MTRSQLPPSLIAKIDRHAEAYGDVIQTASPVLHIQDTAGKPYTVRVVPTGAEYGSGRLLNSGAPMLEFYWATPGRPETFADCYYAPTLVSSVRNGIKMMNAGSFDADTMKRVFVWLLGGNPDSMYV